MRSMFVKTADAYCTENSLNRIYTASKTDGRPSLYYCGEESPSTAGHGAG